MRKAILPTLLIASFSASAQQPPDRRESLIRGANSIQWFVQPTYQDGGPEQRALLHGRATAAGRNFQALLILSCGSKYNETVAGISLRVPAQIVTIDTSSYGEKDPEGEFDFTIANGPQQRLGIDGKSPYKGVFDFDSGADVTDPAFRTLVAAKGQMLTIHIPGTGKGDPITATFRLPVNNTPLASMLAPFQAKAEAAEQALLARRTESCPSLPGRELASAVMLIGRDLKGMTPDLDSAGFNKAAGSFPMEDGITHNQLSQPHTLRCSYALPGHVPYLREIQPSEIVENRLVRLSKRTADCEVTEPPYVVQCYSK